MNSLIVINENCALLITAGRHGLHVAKFSYNCLSFKYQRHTYIGG